MHLQGSSFALQFEALSITRYIQILQLYYIVPQILQEDFLNNTDFKQDVDIRRPIWIPPGRSGQQSYVLQLRNRLRWSWQKGPWWSVGVPSIRGYFVLFCLPSRSDLKHRDHTYLHNFTHIIIHTCMYMYNHLQSHTITHI